MLAVSSSVCSVRVWQTVRREVADNPCGAGRPGVLSVRRVFLSFFVSIHFVRCFWLLVVWRTFREVSSDSPLGADGPQVEDGRSIFRSALLEVRQLFLDSPPLAHGLSAWCLRTVRPLLADGPPRPLQIAYVLCFLSFAFSVGLFGVCL
jgi:hypothetical protein